jgi:hypothetical protein
MRNQEEVWAGGFRALNDLYETYNPKLDLKTAPQRTAAHVWSDLWLSDGRIFKISRDQSDGWAAQVWGSPK